MSLDLSSQSGAAGRYSSWCLFFLLFLVCNGYAFTSVSFEQAAAGEGDIVRQAGYALVFLVAMRVTRHTGWIRTVPLLVMLLLGWCWLSLFWAIEPGISLRRLLLMTFIAATIFATVEAAGSERSFRVVAVLLLVSLAINYVAVAIMPSAIHHAGESTDLALIGNWRGVTNHKNYVGPICAVTVMVLLMGPKVLRPWMNWVAIAAALYFLYRTQSKTSMAVLALSLAVAGLYLVATPRGRRLLLPAALLLLGICLTIFGTEIVARSSDYLSQPGALTGRTEIWGALLQYAGEHVWTGAGYGSFWGIGDKSPVNDLGVVWLEAILTGHNGYLDVLVEVGLPGLLLAILGMVVVPLWQVTHVGGQHPLRAALLLAILTFSICHNVTETSLLSRDIVVGVIFLLAVALTARFAREAAVSTGSFSVHCAPAGIDVPQVVQREPS